MRQVRLGILGLSDGNGHPYSWSAIFNGYDRDKMATCPFPVIPDYLGRQEFPRDQLEGGRVTHIWAQDSSLARDVAGAARIDHVVDEAKDMIGEVDAILLARDDAENHYAMAAPFIQHGLPIYIDKPLALSVAEAERILALAKHGNQIFTCSALAFARELMLGEDDRSALGRLLRVEARVANSWSKYAVHIIEPVLNLIDRDERIVSFERTTEGESVALSVAWTSGLTTRFVTTGSVPTPPQIELEGEIGSTRLEFRDTYAAFKAALERFIAVVRGERKTVSHEAIFRTVQLVEMGGDHV